MSSPVDLLGFLTLGLLGGFAHCVGMCSPFVLLVSRRYAGPARPVIAAQSWYTAGRLVTYVLLGALAGAIGRAVGAAGALLGVQRAAAIVAGAILVVWGAAALLGFGMGTQPAGWFARLFLRVGARMPGHPFVLGLLLGWLPCGLLYSAVVAAMARGGPAVGAAGLAAFGAGTVPALALVSLADDLLARRRPALNRLAHLFVLAMGVWYLGQSLPR